MKIYCERCGELMHESGGLLFAPPEKWPGMSGKGAGEPCFMYKCQKIHLCGECFDFIVAVIFQGKES